jgi:NAD(P)-dependent dehydrogenase (short-subunit alcohol dehydrogenase family)
MSSGFERRSLRTTWHVALFAGMLTLGMSVAREAPPSESAPVKADAARTVLITGANRGLGLEFAKEYHAGGWKVIATARQPQEAKDLKALGDGVRIVALDVTRPESVAALATALDKEPIDLLINNAGQGVGLDRGRGLGEVKMEEFERVIEVNVLGPVRVTQALLPNLRAGKGKMVVGITSGLGSIAGNDQGGWYGYRESKAALDMFIRNLSADLKREGFICVAMNPGWVKTDMGGPNAPLTPEESISGIRRVLDRLKPEDTGKFWSYDGTNMPW